MPDRTHGSTAWLAAATCGALLWSALLLLAPGWQAPASGASTMAPRAVASAMTYLVASRVCHQRRERSVHLHGRAMPLCGRCTGLYLSGAAGLVVGLATGRRRATPASAPRVPGLPAFIAPRVTWLAAAALPTAITWTLEMVGLWDPGTPLRAVAAMPLGATAGVLLATRR